MAFQVGLVKGESEGGGEPYAHRLAGRAGRNAAGPPATTRKQPHDALREPLALKQTLSLSKRPLTQLHQRGCRHLSGGLGRRALVSWRGQDGGEAHGLAERSVRRGKRDDGADLRVACEGIFHSMR